MQRLDYHTHIHAALSGRTGVPVHQSLSRLVHFIQFQASEHFLGSFDLFLDANNI